jgi:hypothetical protein
MFAHISERGAIRWGQLPDAIGVLEAPDKPMSIGIAFGIGWTEGGIALWRLRVRGQDRPGRFVIIDGEFRPAQ